MTCMVEFPEMRNEVIAALRSLSDPAHQKRVWGRVEDGVDYYDDLTLNIHILYDDTQVLPTPETAVPTVLHQSEVDALREVDRALAPLIRDLGNSPDDRYLGDPRWVEVLRASGAALDVMREADHCDPP